MNDIAKKISVIMSVYGYEQYIDDSIKSILNQTFKDFEFIIINDGCSYDLLKKIEKFGDDRIVYMKNPENIGLTLSLIKAVEKSKGKYIARHDAGNISLENRFEIQHTFLENNMRYQLIGSSVELIDENDNTICKIIANSNPDHTRKKMPLYNCINHSTIIFRNNGEADYRGKFKYSQDYDFYLNLLSKKFILGNTEEVLLKERVIPSSITYARKNEQEFFRNRARQFYFERIKYGRDSYDSMEITKNISEPDQSYREKNESEGLYFYNKQKIYYQLFSGRVKEARKGILELLKIRYDLKLSLYLMASFLPFLVRLVNKIKGREYR
ncbi:MAG: glycosyltransferase family 2 protein [Actinomycetota bacterium]